MKSVGICGKIGACVGDFESGLNFRMNISG